MKTMSHIKTALLCILVISINCGILRARARSNAGTDPNKQITTDSNSKSVSQEKSAKYWVERIQKVRGDELMTLLRSVPRIRDPNLIQSILDYAIEDNYSTMYFEGLQGGAASPRYDSTFDEAAGLLYSITKGKIGLKKVGGREVPVPEEKRKTLIMKWRQELPKVKEEFRTEILEKQKEIKPIAHKELLDILAKAEDANNRNEFIKEFKSHKMNDKIETIAYSLVEGIYPYSTNEMVYSDEELKDKRLLPILVQLIKEAKGDKLLTAVWVASNIPDRTLLPILMDYALESDYVRTKKYPSEDMVIYLSVFNATAEAIYRITNKTIGTNNYSSLKIVPDEERSNMIKKWRKIYDETLKKDYEKN